LTSDAFQTAVNKNSLTDIAQYGWSVGDTISIVNKAKYPACATIESIITVECSYTATVTLSSKTLKANRVAIIVASLPFTSRTDVTLKTPDDYTVYACYKKEEVNYLNKITNTRWYPRNGVVELGWAGTAFGVENFTTGTSAFSAGWNNWTAGDFGATFGRDNVSGYAGLVSGEGNTDKGDRNITGGYYNTHETLSAGSIITGSNNINTGSHSVILGTNNTNNKKWNIIAGNNNTVNSHASCVIGEYNKSNSYCGFVGGRYASVVAHTLLALGNGSNDDARENVFHITRATNGTNATISFGTRTENTGYYSGAFGSAINVTGSRSFGFGNIVTITNNVTAGFAAGNNLTLGGKYSAVFGD
jgi:hypothetical protein